MVRIQVRPHMNENLVEVENNPFEGWEISLQKELILESGIDKREWIEKYSAKYREFIDMNPQFGQEIEERKEAIKEKIKNYLYQEIIH